jgi:hypothetical protein
VSEQLYILASDPRMPSKDNLWAAEAASSSEEARARFRKRIKGWHVSAHGSYHFHRMEEDRARRVRDNDFDVELE